MYSVSLSYVKNIADLFWQLSVEAPAKLAFLP